MTTRLLTSRDGVETLLHQQPDGRRLIETRQDVAPHLDHNKMLMNSGDGGWFDGTRTARRVAHIPDVVITLWRNTLGVDVFNPDHKAKVAQLLNSSEWAHLRTGPGRLDPRRA